MPTENTGLPAVCAVIVAAGSSRRMGGENKLLMPLCGRPVLVSSQCAVTKDFAKRSNGGLYFKDYFEFEGCVQYILQNPEAAAELGANGGAFVRENFEWDVIVEKYRTFFQKLMGA